MLCEDVRPSAPSLLSKTCTNPSYTDTCPFFSRAAAFSSYHLRTSFLSLGTTVENPLGFSFTSFAIIQIYKMSSQSWVWNGVTDQYAWRPGTVAPPGHYLNPLCSLEENSGSARPISHFQEPSAPGSAGSNIGGTLPVSNLSAMYTPNSESSLSSTWVTPTYLHASIYILALNKQPGSYIYAQSGNTVECSTSARSPSQSFISSFNSQSSSTVE